jgi:hypothetical protein
MLLTLVILDVHPRQFMRPPHCMTGRFSWHSWLQCLQPRIRQTGYGLWQKFGDSYALETAVSARKPKPHPGDNLRIGFCHDLLSMPWPCFVTQLWSKTPYCWEREDACSLVEFQRVCHSRAVLFGLSCASAACLHRGECKSEDKGVFSFCSGRLCKLSSCTYYFYISPVLYTVLYGSRCARSWHGSQEVDVIRIRGAVTGV